MNTCWGIVTDRDGIASDEYVLQGQLRQRSWASPSAEVRREQANRIPIDYHHNGRELGEVVYLERDEHGRLWAVGQVEASPVVNVQVTRDRAVAVETRMYWSCERRGGPDTDGFIFDAISITPSPARLSAQPLRWRPGSLHERASWNRLDTFEVGLLKRASEAFIRRRYGDPLVVHDEAPQPDDDYPPPGRMRQERLPGGLRRSGHRGSIIGVR